MKAAIFGLAGERLTFDERDFFRDSDPAGYILFGRNIVDKAQLRALTDELRALHGRDALPILIDQEGGRVARLRPPVWPDFPAAARFGDLYQVAPISAIEAARAHGAAIAAVLREAGISVACTPLLDVRQPGASEIIGDRAFGAEPMQVAALGRALIEGVRDGGVVGVVKHMPGHGRALVDSHEALPVVEAGDAALETDLAPFRAINWAPMGMVAHIVYTAWDPHRPASLSETVIGDVIRGRIGFDGLLMSDDIGMHALSGDFGQRAAGAVSAGCDLALHCSGDLTEMQAVAAALGGMSETSRRRLERAMATVAEVSDGPGYDELAWKRDALLAYS